jgi:hypothetical protein
LRKPFLLSNGDVAGAQTGVLIQSAEAPNTLRAIAAIRERLPQLALTVVRQRGEAGRGVDVPGVDYIENEGPKGPIVREVRRRHFDVVFAIYSNEHGFWKLKVLPIFTGAATFIVINENGDWFPVSGRHLNALASHFRWRLESSVTFGPGSGGLQERVLKTTLYPWTLAYLAGYEWWTTRRLQRTSDRVPWKSA